MTALAIFVGVVLVLLGGTGMVTGTLLPGAAALIVAVGALLLMLGAAVGRKVAARDALRPPRHRIGLLTECGLLLLFGGLIGGFVFPLLWGLCGLGLLLAIVGAILDRLERIRAEMAYQRAVAAKATASAEANQVKCPHCAELIKREAKVCRWCNRDIPTSSAIEAVAAWRMRTP